MTNEEIEALRKKWKTYGGKVIEAAGSADGFEAAEFIESLSYSETKVETPEP